MIITFRNEKPGVELIQVSYPDGAWFILAGKQSSYMNPFLSIELDEQSSKDFKRFIQNEGKE